MLRSFLKTEKIKSWVPLALAITGLSGLVYLALQQSIRSSANDPQIQLAEDFAATLGTGIAPQSILPQGQLDISKSLAPYAIIYDEGGNPLGSSGILDGKIPQAPKGVLDYVKKYGENRITWQPKEGVRSAIVVKSFTSNGSTGYVLIGRSLREVEKRADQIILQVGLAWIATLIVSLFAALLF